MESFLEIPFSERREIISEAAVRMNVDFTIIEKDFWVCWTLRQLFSLPTSFPSMVFKGGTSLSKGYGLIQRFSEDIDVVTDVSFYIARGCPDPEQAASRTGRRKNMATIDAEAVLYIANDMLPALREHFAARLQSNPNWALEIDPEDKEKQTLLFRYPKTDPTVEHSYIRDRVKIEFGWRSSMTPLEQRTFQPYIADYFPEQMRQPNVTCSIMLPHRTFWEKVTILHAETFREKVDDFFSRHYADVASMLKTLIGLSASNNLAMLDEVRLYKDRYYHSGWTNYDKAVPGTLKLVPSTSKIQALKNDYSKMRSMFFTDPPAFDSIMEQLRAFEFEMNRRV